MSGGPIISASTGRVIGVISHGIDEPATGYGACLAGIIELPLTLRGVDGSEHTFRGHELVSRKLIQGDHGNVELTRSPDGVVLTWRQAPPGTNSRPGTSEGLTFQRIGGLVRDRLRIGAGR
jgi:hypothetical protein